MAAECNGKLVQSAVKRIFGMPIGADEAFIGLRGNCIDQGCPSRTPLTSKQNHPR